MQATIVDLRYKMKEVLLALKRNETVSVHYHNKEIASIIPSRSRRKAIVKEHPFFGMLQHDENSVEKAMSDLRAGRYLDL